MEFILREVNKNTNLSFDDIENRIKNSRVIGSRRNWFRFLSLFRIKEKQLKFLKLILKASKEFDLPIIIHQRNSEKEIIEVLKKYKNDNLKIVFHCFTGSKELLQFL